MSTLTYNSNVGYNSVGKTYQGDGILNNRRRLPGVLAERLRRPNNKISILITVTAGLFLKGAVVHSGRVMKFTKLPTFVTEVVMNGGELTLTTTASLATCVATVATFFYDSSAKVLYVNPPNPSSRSFFDDVYQARLIFYFAKQPKKLRGVFWDPRLVSAPDISLRIEARFSGVGQIGGGKLTLNNTDGHFDQLDELQWDAGRVVMELGSDLPDGSGDMLESDYQKVGTWRTEKTGRAGLNFELSLREPKTNLENKAPHREYSRTEFPNIAEDQLGKPIPMAWGTLFSKSPMLIDKAAKKFKLADHPIWGIEAIRINTDTEGWKEINYLTQDLTKAEFTLGADWTDEDVAVDFKGRLNPDGSLMENPSDVASDILNYWGESKLDATSFFLTRDWFVIGADRFDQEVTELAPCIYLDTLRTGLDLMSELNSICGTFLFVDHEGLWRFGAFQPVRAQDLDPIAGSPMQIFTDREIYEGSMSKSVDSSKLASKLTVRYAERTAENWAPTITESIDRNQFIHDLPPQFVETKTIGVGKFDDAQYWLERYLTTEAVPLTKYQFSVPWPGLFVMPGDKCKVKHSLRGINAVLEVLEAHYSFNSPPSVRFVCGNLRGWGDTFGFWADDGADTGVPQAGLNLWLAASDLKLSNAEAVQQWTDKSGRQNHATQTVFANRPIFGSFVGPNDDPGVTFSLNQFLNLPSFAINFQQAEMFVVLRAPTDPQTDPKANTPWDFGVGGGDFTEYPNVVGNVTEGWSSGNQAATLGNPATALDGFHIYNVSRADAATMVARVNNTIFFTGNPGTTFGFAAPHYLGKTSADATRYFGGTICEILMYDRVLSTAERAAVVQFLSDKFLLGIVAVAAEPDWNPAWTDDQAADARQNRGYWTAQDANGKETDMADVTDARSFETGRWW